MRFVFGLALVLAASTSHALTTDALLDSLQQTAFDYFWNEANATTGLIKDRSTSGSPCSIAALGFGLSAICIGIDHGWVTRDAGRARIRTALETLWTKPQSTSQSTAIGYKGLYYHFLFMNTGFRAWNSELSTIDTALLFAGVLDAKQYFSTADTLDVRVRALADSIYYRADWNFMRNFGNGIMMGWKPETGFATFGRWIGYNEAMILYILALGSPTHPVPTSPTNQWTTWTSGYSWQTHYGYSYVNFPPLFGHQYSHCWVDFHDIWDPYMQNRGITYWENSRRATLAQREYCIDNPFNRVGYGPDLWGLTASDGPTGYAARGAPPAQNDDGTITPTAPASSIAFAPAAVIPVLHNLFDTYGAQLWGAYGFKDAFNLGANWWGQDFLGIDQGPIIVMIENFRTQAVWNRFMQNPDIQVGLARAGFVPAPNVGSEPFDGPAAARLLAAYPNPMQGSGFIPFRLPAAGPVSLILYDAAGRQVRTLVAGPRAAGTYRLPFDAGGIANGTYWCELRFGDARSTRRFTVLR